MVNVLLEGYDIRAKWIYRELKNYIKPSHRVAVIAFSFRESRVKNISEWNAFYGTESGFYRSICRNFAAYGIEADRISFVNYFQDTRESARYKIENADIIYFPSGLPDRMMERIDEFGLQASLARHQGMVMGCSAGALIQLSEYHLSPDHDYPTFCYCNGLGYVDGFYLEIHYEGSEVQKESIRRILNERKNCVYATGLMKGAVLVNGKDVRLLGEVHTFHPLSKELRET